LPLDATDLRVVIGNQGETGSIWIDNIQFEPNDHATPYADGARLPHDEYLAARGFLP
jgi:hypothetical protein